MEYQNESKCSKCRKNIDMPDLIILIITVIASVATFLLTKLNPLYVPENDSLSNFPIPSHETIPGIYLFLILFLVPEVTFLLLYFLSKKFSEVFQSFNIYGVTWNLITSQLAVQLLTEVIKSYVGRARPDMYSRCGYNAQYETCNQKGYILNDSFKSFPSGHSSGAMSAMYFTAVFILKCVNSPFSSLVALLYILLALYIGSTRIRDFRHHVDDVVAGFFVGYIVTKIIWKNAKKRIFPIIVQQNHDSLQETLVDQV